MQAGSVRYFHTDHLGSVTAITDETGLVVERLAYDAWGKRRFTNGTADVNDTVVGLTTDRGYTEHEMLDELGIIHMNGRVYDPYIGRFMSADPYIQAPYELQSHNRYAYVMNNPLLYTDPSGFNWFKKLFIAVVIIVATVYTMGAVAMYMTGAATMSAAVTAAGATLWGSIAMGAAGGFVGGFLGSALNGGSFSQSLKAGIIGGATGAAMGYVGFSWAGNTAANYLGHAVVSCASSVASGGNSSSCGRAALASMLSTAVSANTTDENGWNVYSRGVATTAAGGVTSRMMGGSFADGATTAAYGYLFNCVNHECWKQAGEGAVKVIAGGLSVATAASICPTTGAGCIPGVFLFSVGADGIVSGGYLISDAARGITNETTSLLKEKFEQWSPEYGGKIYEGANLAAVVASIPANVPLFIVDGGTLASRSLFGLADPSRWNSTKAFFGQVQGAAAQIFNRISIGFSTSYGAYKFGNEIGK